MSSPCSAHSQARASGAAAGAIPKSLNDEELHQLCELATANSRAVGCQRDHQAEVELAPFMSRLQLFSQTLGYSIQAENVPLSKFYLHELHEIVEEIEHQVPEHDGFPIAKLVKATVEPSLEALSLALDDKRVSWKQHWHTYEATISSCNACHTATAHGFIHIPPSSGGRSSISGSPSSRPVRPSRPAEPGPPVTYCGHPAGFVACSQWLENWISTGGPCPGSIDPGLPSKTMFGASICPQPNSSSCVADCFTGCGTAT